MLAKNQELECVVEALGAQAEGICRHEGLVVFVPGALPGETIRLQVLKVQNSHAFGKLLKVLVPSRERTEPPCPYFAKCGGCSCQHMQYEAQLRFKTSQVESCLKRIAGIGINVPETVGMEHPWHYRNKTSMPVQEISGTPQAGYFAPRSHRLVPIGSCMIAKIQSDAVSRCVMDWMAENLIPAYQESTSSGLIRHIITRVNSKGEVMVTLAVNGWDIPKQTELINSLDLHVQGFASLCITTREESDNVILGAGYHVIYGVKTLTDNLGSYEFSLSPLSFFQVNTEICEKMYRQALAFADIKTQDTVVDLYCGIGTLTLMASAFCKKVIGIEVSRQAVLDAGENTEINRVDNVEFVEGYAEEALPRLIQKGLHADIVLLDPPRKGAHPAVLRSIADASPRKIVYISCHPASQARDAAILKENGYHAFASQPFDMFCQTSEVENVLAFTKD